MLAGSYARGTNAVTGKLTRRTKRGQLIGDFANMANNAKQDAVLTMTQAECVALVQQMAADLAEGERAVEQAAELKRAAREQFQQQIPVFHASWKAGLLTVGGTRGNSDGFKAAFEKAGFKAGTAQTYASALRTAIRSNKRIEWNTGREKAEGGDKAEKAPEAVAEKTVDGVAFHVFSIKKDADRKARMLFLRKVADALNMGEAVTVPEWAEKPAAEVK